MASGCGDDGSEGPQAAQSSDANPTEQRAVVAATVKQFMTATIDQDAKTFCSLVTGDYKSDVIATGAAAGGELDCPSAMEKAFGFFGADDFERVRRSRDVLKPTDVTIAGSRATVRYASGRRQPLVLAGNRWLIAGEAK